MFGLNALAKLVTGLYRANKEVKQKDVWFRLVFSMAATAFVSFAGTFGMTLTALQGSVPVELTPGMATGHVLFAVGVASVTMGVTVAMLFKRSPMTKGMSILIPSKIEEKILEQEHEGVSVTTRK